MKNDSNLIIRRAEAGDGPELLMLIQKAMALYARQSGIEAQLDAQLETLADLETHIAADLVLVAIDHGHLAGTVRLVRQDQETAYFCRFAVLPVLHRSGVGQRLYQAAEQWLTDQGFHSVYLHTATNNKPLVAFYEARGFHLVDIQYDRGYPRGTFRKELPAGSIHGQARETVSE